MTDSVDQNVDQLAVLKERADKLGISYHPNIGEDKLRERINEELGNDEPATEEAPVEVASGESPRQKATKLKRCLVTCMNPNKKEWQGELFSAGNSKIGTVKKYVPFDTEWHVPQIIYNMIKERQCQIFVKKRTDKGVEYREGKLIREFNVVDLAALTEQELKDLAQRQAMASGTSDNA